MRGKPTKIFKSSFIAELVVWLAGLLGAIFISAWEAPIVRLYGGSKWYLAFAIPVIFSIWRYVTSYTGCPTCKCQSIVPLDSPAGQKLAKDMKKAT